MRAEVTLHAETVPSLKMLYLGQNLAIPKQHFVIVLSQLILSFISV